MENTAVKYIHFIEKAESYKTSDPYKIRYTCTWSQRPILYSVSHIITYPSKELCSKMALGEVGVSLP